MMRRDGGGLRVLAIAAIVVVGGVAAIPAWAHLPDSVAVPAGAGSRLRIGDLWVVLPLALAAVAYGGAVVRLWGRAGIGAGIRIGHAGCFAVGWLLLAAALLSPIDRLGAELFAAHMVQHELLMIAAAPLLMLGRPAAAGLWLLPRAWRGMVAAPCVGLGRTVMRGLARPAVATVLYAVVLWAWHVPGLFRAALAGGWIHDLQHVSFFGAALLFWGMVFHHRAGEAGRGGALMALFATAVHGSILGALLTFSSTVLYPSYADTAPAFGLTALEDQRLGGLIMWVPAGAVHIAAAVALAARWLADSEARSHRPGEGPRPAGREPSTAAR